MKNIFIQAIKLVVKNLSFIFINGVWWVFPFVISKLWGLKIVDGNLFIIFSFVIFLISIIKSTSISIKIPGLTFSTDKLGQLFKASYKKKNGNEESDESYEYFYSTPEEFEGQMKVFKDNIKYK